MTNKLNLFFLFFLALLASCEEQELTEKALEGLSATADSHVNPVIFSENFEGPAPFCQAHNTDFGKSHSFAVVNSPVFKGDKAGRFKLKASDPMVSSGTRAEVTVIKDGVQKEMWYSFAVLFPADGYDRDSGRETISQWHQMSDVHLGEKPQSPATFLGVRNDRFILDTGYNTKKVSSGVVPGKRESYDLGPVTKDTWHGFVFHFIHSYQSEGLIEIWHNGKKILRHTGGNMYNSEDMPKWKLGIYKWKWNGEGTSDTRKRILYYDNIKAGSAKASLSEMTPEQGDNPGSQTGQVGNQYTIVDAETERDLMPLTNKEALLIQNVLKTKKFTVRANLADPRVTGVKFVLKGARNHTYVDDEKPFALFGDDGKGNYYYGSILPTGRYSVYIIPYFKPGAKGKSGPEHKASFVIKKY
ncbi:MAG: polysaccharide lyase [Adhaeribacter sp.]